MTVGWRGAVGLVAVLAIGASLGILLDRAILLSAGSPDSTEELHDSLIETMESNVGLTEDQRHEIENIVNRHQGTINDAWHEIRPHLAHVVDSMRAEIEVVLRPEQRHAFDEWWVHVHPDPGSGMHR